MESCGPHPRPFPHRSLKHEVERSLIELEVDKEAGTATAELCFSSDLAIFAGHFPGMPIVPGIYLVEACRLIAERVRGHRLELVEVVNARFTGEVHPEDRVRAQVALSQDGEIVCGNAVFSTANSPAAKVRLALRQT